MTSDSYSPEPQTCANCDTELPEESEGLCPQCGTPFGLKTMVMPAISREEIERRKKEREAKDDD